MIKQLIKTICELKDNSDLEDIDYIYGNYYFEYAVFRHRTIGDND